jgi:hypothetical protein
MNERGNIDNHRMVYVYECISVYYKFNVVAARVEDNKRFGRI